MGSPILNSALLERSASGLFYVEDKEGGRYEIEGFLGDVWPHFQIFKAKFTSRNNTGDHQVVALKLAKSGLSPEFQKVAKEVDDSFQIGPNDDQENGVITSNNIIVGIYKSFYYKAFFCVSMPYMNGGSLRYIITSRLISCRGLPDEKCIALVLRETLKGLCFLHGRGKVHGNLNAGHIFVSDSDYPLAIKLGYKESTYFHHPAVDSRRRIWEVIWDTDPQKSLFWKVSRLPDYKAECGRRLRGMYEPTANKCTSASDIWNLGITAIELALGGLYSHGGMMRSPDEMRAFLTKFLNNDETGLPKLQDIFVCDPQGLNFHNRLSSSFIAMVKRCLVLDPDSRPTAQMLLNDPFFVEHQDAADLQHFADVVLRNWIY